MSKDNIAATMAAEELASALGRGTVGNNNDTDPNLPPSDQLLQTSSGNNANNNILSKQQLVDPITSLQDAIDGLSLAMFEALRGLRDAVAPESGNIQVATAAAAVAVTGNNNAETTKKATNDVDEIWNAYCTNDPTIVVMMEPYIQQYYESTKNQQPTIGSKKQSSSSSKVLKREEFIKLYIQMEHDKDSVLVEKLANDVLQKSYQIDLAVDDHYNDNNNDDANDDETDVDENDTSNNNNDAEQQQQQQRPGNKKRKLPNNNVPYCSIPGMHRTRDEQMQYIEQLIQDNVRVANELQEVYTIAQQRQQQCRQYIKLSTARALSITEE